MKKASAWVYTHAPTGTRWGIRTLSLLLSLVLCLSLLPGAAFAAEDGSHEETSPLTVTVEAEVQRVVKNDGTNEATKGYQGYDPDILDDPENVMVGDEIWYTITVTNNTNEKITGVQITDIFNGAGTLYRHDSMNGTKDELTKSDGMYTLGSDVEIAPGYPWTIRLIYVVQYNDTVLGTSETEKKLTNTAKVVYGDKTYEDTLGYLVNTDTFNLVVTKSWTGGNERPEVTVMLCPRVEGEEQNRTAKIQWEQGYNTVKYTLFENLPLRDTDGNRINYSVKETEIHGATLIEEGAIKDFGSGERTCDIFKTKNDDVAVWYAVYDDTDAADGRVSITNRYVEKTIVVSTRINGISRDGGTLYGNSDGQNTDPVPALRAGDVIKYNITVRNYMGEEITLTVTDQLIGGSEKTWTWTEELEQGWRFVVDANAEEDVLTYTVQEGDGVPDSDGKYYLTNRLTATYDGKEYQAEVKAEVEREEETYTIYVPIEKTLTNEGKDDFESTERFEFEIYTVSDDTEKVLGEDYISVSKVAAGTSTIKSNATWDGHGNVDGVDYSFQLTKSDYEKLPEENGFRYVWVSEVNNGTERMTYSTDKIKLYLIPVEQSAGPQSMPSMLTVNAEGEALPTNDATAPEASTYYALDAEMYNYEPWNGDMTEIYDFAAEFWNYYDKQERRDDTVKEGPQLNRDDHVAYIMGYSDGTVRPESEITRAETCTIFFRLLTEESRSEYLSKTNGYTDVAAGDWCNTAISTLSNAGIVTGYKDGTFRPDQPITRGEMAKIIAGFAKLSEGSKTFSDLDGHWAKSYVELAAGNGWIAGYPDGTFRPDQKITRAETVTMINRVLGRVPAAESRLLSRSTMLTFPDNNPGDWYYIAIQEASNSHEYERSVYETTGDETWVRLIENVDWAKLER